MLTLHDEKRGIIKTDWASVHKKVEKVEPDFARIVNGLSPGPDFSLYLLYFPYGDLKGDTISSFIPKIDGGYYRLSSPNAPKVIKDDLGYGMNGAPLGLLLEKNLELFWDLADEKITIPKIVYTPGSFLSVLNNLTPGNGQYTSSKIYSLSSGGRSVFMLPSIGNTSQHSRLQSHFNFDIPPAKSLYDEWSIFKEIIQSNIMPCEWRSCILYFSNKWVEKIHNDIAWQPLKVYLYEKSWVSMQYDFVAHSHYDCAFSMIQKKRNLKPNPYLADTSKHLFSIALGDSPGFAPACDEETLPLKLLQEAFVNVYGLKKYHPTIMQPEHILNKKDVSCPVYYSLQNPSTYSFSPRSSKFSSTIKEIRELAHIVNVFKEELSKKNTICSDSALGRICKTTQFKYYHNEVDQHQRIYYSDSIMEDDQRFNIAYGLNSNEAKFAESSSFFRGCVSIT